MGMTLWLQCAGMAILIRLARVYLARGKWLTAWHGAVLMVRFTTLIIILHLLQILLWAGFYRWRCLPTWEMSFYFSATSYSTVGYGDVTLAPFWRFLGAIESVVGVLMCGMSVSALLALATKLLAEERVASVPSDRQAPDAVLR